MPGTAGRIESVLIDVGDELKAGDPIAVVESEIYATQLRQAEAGLEAARLGLTKMEEGARPEQIAAAQAAVQFTRNEYDKVAWAGQAGMLPQALQLEQATIAYETAKAAYELQTNPSDLQLSPLMAQLAQAELALALAKQPFTETDFDMARAQVELAEAAVDMARKQVDETIIRAPFDGVVGELYITKGSMAAPQAPAALFVSKPVEVIVNIEESRISHVQAGQNAALQVSAFPGQDFPASVTNVAPTADSQSHTFAVKVTPMDEDYLLRSGMYANVSLLVEEVQGTLLVPRAAVTDVNGQETVYVVNDDDTVERRAVTTGLVDDDRVEILSGLTEDQQVVVAGQAGLQDGAKVEIRN
jgi:RND family efflux transporter MFP subunit